MAYILVNIAKANGDELKITEGITQNIKDYYKVSLKRKDAVETAYSPVPAPPQKESPWY